MARHDRPQISAHICAAERAAFETYATTFGLDAAGLLALLLVRELRVDRLADLLGGDRPLKAARDSKVTVHGNVSLRASIAARAEKCGTSLSNACAVLMRAELRERWLERSIATRIES